MNWTEYKPEELQDGKAVLIWHEGTFRRAVYWEEDEGFFYPMCSAGGLDETFVPQNEIEHIMRISPPEGFLGSTPEGGVE